MNRDKKTCGTCVLHTDVPGVTVNDKGICSVCENYNKFHPHEPRLKKYLFEEMENLFKKVKQDQRPYDAIVLFSGGKDSTVLLKMAKEKYRLRPLAISVMHPLVNETAAKNMENAARQLNIELLKIFPAETVYKKVMNYGILNSHKYGLGEFFGCDVCSFFHSWLPIKYAMMMEVPIIMEGSDSSQAKEITYWQAEKVKADARQGKKPFGSVHDLVMDALGEEYKGSIYDYNETEITNGKYPTFISPFTFMEYDYRQNFKEIAALGLEEKKFRSIYTNCSATPFFTYFSLKRHGCVSYIKHYAAEVRKGYPNLMQRSVKDADTAEALNKEAIEKLMEEYKNIVLYTVENKIDQSNITDAVKEKLKNMAPTYMDIFGTEVCDIFLDDVLKITFYADYFGVALE